MHILDDDKTSSASAAHPKPSAAATQPNPSAAVPQKQQKKMDYSHCPLKKRPVNYDCVKFEYVKEENMEIASGADDNAEPENLSTKPQDLSVKCKPAVTVPFKRESSPVPAFQPHHNMATPPPSPAYQQQEQHRLQNPLHQLPFQPMAVKPGPLEPLCLNIAAGDYAPQHHMQQSAYMLHHAQEQNNIGQHQLLLQQQQQRASQIHYVPARPVPAQYPGYLTNYVQYHQAAATAVQQYPSAVGTVLVRARDPSPSPPGSASAGSAFRPLHQQLQQQQLMHASPPAAASCITISPFSPPQQLFSPPYPYAPPQQQHLQQSTAVTWYGRPWSTPSSAPDQLSPPHTLSSMSSLSPPSVTSSAVSPPYGLQQQQQQPPPPPPPPVYMHQIPVQQHTVVAAVDDRRNNNNSNNSNNNNNNNNTVIAVATTTGSGMRYKCNRCAKTYATGSGLSRHQQQHCARAAPAGGLQETAPLPSAAAGRIDDGALEAEAALLDVASKTFRCKYCGKAYNTLGALKMHIRTHTLPCICNMCGKAFSRPWLLQGHIRTHTGEKPFSCAFCNRAFADRSNLRAHLQTHSDVKKYSCPTCSKTFSRMSLLTKHTDTGCPRIHAPAAAGAPGSPEPPQEFKTEPEHQ